MQSEQKHYYAFVSHSSRDAKIALWLRDKLVNYNIPASIRKENQMPKRLRPVFIYQTDLAGANLQDALQRELEDSQWLIVICSPDGAKSQYVNGEVEHFINTGRANKIIPFIVGGTPHAKNPDDECFPPALLKLAEDGIELRGVNLAECQKQLGSKMGAVVNVVATMLGVRFDSMWNVYQRKQRRQQIYAAVIAVLFCIIGFLAWEYWHPRYEYFADYVDKWGVPEGAVQLTKEQVSHRMRSFRFKYRRIPIGEPDAWQWRLVQVQAINSAGNLSLRIAEEMSGGTRYPKIDLEYDKNTGELTYWVISNRRGTPWMRRQMIARNGVPAAIVDLKNANLTNGEYFAEAVKDRDNGGGGSNIVRFAFERNEQGYITKETYHCNNDYNLDRSAVADGDGIYARQFEVDSLGRVVRMEYLNKEGKPTQGYMGLSAMTYTYDQFGIVIELAYWDIDGKPLVTESGWSKCVRQSDQYGNVAEYRYLGQNGEPCLSIWHNYAGAKQTFDDKGDLVVVEHFGVDGKPCMKNELGAKVVRKYNKLGLITEEASYDTLGNLCIVGWEQCAIKRTKYDSKGREIEYAGFGVNGEPVMMQESQCHRTTTEYSSDRNTETTIESFYDTEGKPCISAYGCSKLITKVYLTKKYIERASFGISGEPFVREDGVYMVRTRYDERNQLAEIAYFGTDSLPTLSTDMGVHKTVLNYDENGHLREVKHFGTDGKPCLCNFSYCSTVYDVNDKGNDIAEAYYDIDGSPVPLPVFVQPKQCERPAYKKLTEYNEFDKVSVMTYLDAEGAVLLRRIFEYNEYYEPVSVQCEIYQNGKLKSTVTEEPKENMSW